MPCTRNLGDELEQPIDEIEHFIHIKRHLEQLFAQFDIPMVANIDNFPLKEFSVPSQDEPHSIIVNPAIQANNFVLKPSLL